nr:hypothetical protein [Tanacetum cinerariifolium]
MPSHSIPHHGSTPSPSPCRFHHHHNHPRRHHLRTTTPPPSSSSPSSHHHHLAATLPLHPPTSSPLLITTIASPLPLPPPKGTQLGCIWLAAKCHKGAFGVAAAQGVRLFWQLTPQAYDGSSPEVEMRWWSWCGVAGGVGGDFRGGGWEMETAV